MTIAGRTVDRNLQLLIEDVVVMRDALRDERNRAREHVVQVAAGYLVLNKELIDHAFAAWQAASEEELQALAAQDRQLDGDGASHRFGSVAYAAVDSASAVLIQGPGGVSTLDDDDLHVLLRVLDYAKYILAGTGEKLHWHPVRDLLTGDTAQVDALRIRVLAQWRSERGSQPEPQPESESPTQRANSEPSLVLSNAAARTLSLALGLPATSRLYASDDPGLLAAAVFLGALQLPPAEFEHTLAADLSRHLAERLPSHDVNATAAAALGINQLPPPVEGVDAARVRASPFAAIVEQASAHAAAGSGATDVHLRHLLVAAFLWEPSTVLDMMLDELESDRAAVSAMLRAALARVPDERASYWDATLGPLTPDLELAGGISADVVDATRGIPISNDHLGVRDYVTMLATVISDRRTPMPLSIGLFGEWGSGKSYFMGLLREQVDTLSGSSDEPYLRDIRQIGFNAWHYADTNLWASLGDEIFAQLAGPGEQPDKKREQLRHDLSEKLQRRRELEAATARARDATTRLSKELDDARAKRASSLKGLANAVSKSPEVRKLWGQLGIKEPLEQGELLAREIRGSATDADTLRHSLPSGRLWGIIALAALAAALLAAAILIPSDVRIVALGGAVSAVGAVLTVVQRLRTGLRTLNDVAVGLRTDADDVTKAKLEAVRASEADERVAQAQIDEVIDQVGVLGRQLAELDPGQRLYRFVSDRAGDETYRRHLGLISTVRKDFEQLTLLMKEWEQARTSTPDSLEPIDRIVLYIDDLDRCSPEQVVEVLQAVHLLLAVDLFVVVVGVDPRWLLRSLRREYQSILTSDDGAEAEEGWVTTPQDYLEKIFNIPFTLPAMTSGSFRGLLESMADAGSERRDARLPASTAAPTDTVLPEPSSQEVPVADVSVEPHSEVARAHAGVPAAEVRPLGKAELDLLAALAPLVATPREAKRLLNLYRMVRSTRNLSPASQFLGDASHPGDYQAVIVLLGLLSSHGRFLEAVLAAEANSGPRVQGGLMRRSPGETWAAFASGLAPRDSEGAWENDIVGAISAPHVAGWQQLATGLVDATAFVTLPDLTTFQLWAPRVARFSFLSNTLVYEEAALTGERP